MSRFHALLICISYIAEMDLIGQILGQIEDTVPTVRDFYVQDALSSTTLPR